MATPGSGDKMSRFECEIVLALFANSEYNSTMNLKPQDIFILLKLVALGEDQWSYASLAGDLFMSTSEVHAGIKRAVAARLMDSHRGRPLKKVAGRIPHSWRQICVCPGSWRSYPRRSYRICDATAQ